MSKTLTSEAFWNNLNIINNLWLAFQADDETQKPIAAPSIQHPEVLKLVRSRHSDRSPITDHRSPITDHQSALRAIAAIPLSRRAVPSASSLKQPHEAHFSSELPR